MRLSVVIPSFNELHTERSPPLGDVEIIIVEDCSMDGTTKAQRVCRLKFLPDAVVPPLQRIADKLLASVAAP